MNYDQGDVKPFKTINDADEEYRYMTTNGEVIFDFYKLNDKYLPSFAHTSGEYYMLYDDQKHTGTFNREITFSQFYKSDNKGLTNKIDFGKTLEEYTEWRSKSNTHFTFRRRAQFYR